jgi:hypothetical protein
MSLSENSKVILHPCRFLSIQTNILFIVEHENDECFTLSGDLCCLSSCKSNGVSVMYNANGYLIYPWDNHLFSV